MRERWGVPAALILFCTLWRLPSLGDPPWLNDEGTYATVGRAIASGEELYRQVWENKPPAIYLLNAAVHVLVGPAHLLVGVRLLALIAAIITQVAVYRLMLSARGRSTALLAVALCGVGLDLPLLDGASANAEIFLAAASATGMALLWHVIARNRGEGRELLALCSSLVLAGVAFGLAILFKLPGGADLLAALAILLTRRGGFREQLIAPVLLAFGTALPVGAVAVWLVAHGILGDALYATIGYNRGYVTTGQSDHPLILTLLGLLGLLALLGLGGWLARRQRIAARPSFGAGCCWWLALALLGALASGRSYPHYYLQAVAPAALCLALLIDAARDRRAVGTVLVGLLLIWSAAVPAVSWAALQRDNAASPPGSNYLAYYADVWQHLTGGLDDTAYGNRIDPRVERNVAIARYLKARPLNPRRLYIWGNTPWIYYLSGYEHAARFLSAYYRPVIPGGAGQVLSALRRQPPPYIVVIEPPLPASPSLNTFLRVRYRPVWRVENAVIYRLR